MDIRNGRGSDRSTVDDERYQRSREGVARPLRMTASLQMWSYDVDRLSARVYICALLCSSSQNVKQFNGLIVRAFTFSDPADHQFYSVNSQFGDAPF